MRKRAKKFRFTLDEAEVISELLCNFCVNRRECRAACAAVTDSYKAREIMRDLSARLEDEIDFDVRWQARVGGR